MEYHDPYEDYLTWKNRQNTFWSKLSRKVNPSYILFFFLILFFANSMVSNGTLSRGQFFAVLIPCIILLVSLANREPQIDKLIPEQIIKEIAQEALERKRKEGIEIPFDAQVNVTLQGGISYETDYTQDIPSSGPTRRDVGFEVVRKSYVKKGVIERHPYTGAVGGIRWEKMGYSGKETKDKIIVPVKEIERKD
jgi:hypothetical protein